MSRRPLGIAREDLPSHEDRANQEDGDGGDGSPDHLAFLQLIEERVRPMADQGNKGSRDRHCYQPGHDERYLRLIEILCNPCGNGHVNSKEGREIDLQPADFFLQAFRSR